MTLRHTFSAGEPETRPTEVATIARTTFLICIMSRVDEAKVLQLEVKIARYRPLAVNGPIIYPFRAPVS